MKLCVALDRSSKENNLALLEQLKAAHAELTEQELQKVPEIYVKVGLRSFIRDGVSFIREIEQKFPQFPIFLDLKLYDIPNTMADAAEECANLGVSIITIHASAGVSAMEQVAKRLENLPKKPLVFAVTALTSFSPADFAEIYSRSIDTAIVELAQVASGCKMDGVVCSAWEVAEIKEGIREMQKNCANKENFKDLLCLCPGIRPENVDSDDQMRVATISQAKEEGADFIVIGRPIYRSADPKAAVLKVIREMCL